MHRSWAEHNTKFPWCIGSNGAQHQVGTVTVSGLRAPPGGGSAPGSSKSLLLPLGFCPLALPHAPLWLPPTAWLWWRDQQHVMVHRFMLVIKRAAAFGTGLGTDESLQKVLPSEALSSHGEVFSMASASWMSDVPSQLHDFHYFKEPLAQFLWFISSKIILIMRAMIKRLCLHPRETSAQQQDLLFASCEYEASLVHASRSRMT